ncbi:MAG: hypothetical protein WCH59_11095 [Chitinophagia bacterium]|jgi:hypothetical protein
MRGKLLIQTIGYFLFVSFLSACSSLQQTTHLPNTSRLSASAFFVWASHQSAAARDSAAVAEILSGNYPSHTLSWKTIHTEIQIDDATIIRASYQVSSDYLSLGTEKDWSRIPLTPHSAQLIADSFHCFLPTRKMVNDIYRAARVKLSPMPMFAFRDSSITLYQHHLIIEGMRKGAKGLIGGIKKDLVISSQLNQTAKPNREAIYGWHRLNGQPIQPLYTGHVNWYVDYSHGVRLIKRNIRVNGKDYDYIKVLQDPVLYKLLCDEPDCRVYRYE